VRSREGSIGARRCEPADRHCLALPCRSFFKINRDTPEAKANQIEWARKQMDLEVPEVTATGNEIQDREDFVRQACDSSCGRAAARTDACPGQAYLTLLTRDRPQ
jgi:hypothetical protein